LAKHLVLDIEAPYSESHPLLETMNGRRDCFSESDTGGAIDGAEANPRATAIRPPTTAARAMTTAASGPKVG